MVRFVKRHPPPGSRPGTLVIPADAPPPTIRVTEYDADGVDERTVDRPAGLRPGTGRRRWIAVQGLGDETILREIADEFDIHPLALEDVVNVPQRPKAEEYPDHLLIISRLIAWERGTAPRFAQVAIFLGTDYVLTFEERPGPALDPVQRRIHEGRGPIRSAGHDYLAYAILDTAVDGYYPPITAIGEYLEQAEPGIMKEPRVHTLDQLAETKSVLVTTRRIVLPQRNVLSELLGEESVFLSDDVRVYLRDTLDHCRQIVEGIDSDRELANDLMNTYLSIVSHRTNEVMRVLTIVASIFIPLTFMAGIYGMNFEAMPELRVAWAYPALLVAMGGVAGGLLLFFRRMGWLGQPRGAGRDREPGPVG